MADTSIAITAGSGTAVDTRTEGTNGNHRQVVVLGDPATNAGVAPVDVTNGLSVTLTTALPAGSAAIGKLAANSGVDIGDVDVTTVGTITPGVAATSLGKAEDAAHSSGDVGVMGLTVRQDTAAALAGTDGDYQPPITDASGRMHVNVGTSALPTGAATASNQSTANTSLGNIDTTLGAKADAKSTATDTTSISAMSVLKQISASVQAPPSQAVTNAGTFAVQESGTQVVADDAAFTPGTTKVVMAGFEADESSTDSVDEGDGGAARMTLDRKVIVNVQPHTAGGLSTMNATSSDGGTALTNTAQVISAAAGQVYGWYIYNPNSSAQFVLFYNIAAASVTVGTTNPLFMLTIPAVSAANVNMVQGITFSNAGFSWAAASTAGGNGAPSTALDAVAFYK